MAGWVTCFGSSRCPRSFDCPLILQHPQTHKPPAVDSPTTGTRAMAQWHCWGNNGSSSPHQTMNFTTITRTAIRSSLIQQGPQTCSDLVRGMGLDPKRHKGTIHAIMVDLEREGVLGATMKGTRRDVWFAHTDRIRKRDRIIAALIG